MDIVEVEIETLVCTSALTINEEASEFCGRGGGDGDGDNGPLPLLFSPIPFPFPLPILLFP